MESNKDTNNILSMSKTFNHSTELKTDAEALIKEKIIKLRNNYNFSMSYSLSILNILKLFHKCLFEKVFNTLNENRTVFNVFKEISEFYQSFSEHVLKSNKNLSSLGEVPKIFNDGLKSMLESTQNALVRNFLDISNNLKIKIMSKGQIERTGDFEVIICPINFCFDSTN